MLFSDNKIIKHNEHKEQASMKEIKKLQKS